MHVLHTCDTVMHTNQSVLEHGGACTSANILLCSSLSQFFRPDLDIVEPTNLGISRAPARSYHLFAESFRATNIEADRELENRAQYPVQLYQPSRTTATLHVLTQPSSTMAQPMFPPDQKQRAWETFHDISDAAKERHNLPPLFKTLTSAAPARQNLLRCYVQGLGLYVLSSYPRQWGYERS